MALQKTVTTSSGVDLTDAYHKVTKTRWRQDKPTVLRFELCTYPSSTESDNGLPAADEKSYVMSGFNKAGDNALTQVYTWLKDPANGTGFDTGTTDV